jgi:hypothetical protein
VRLAFVPDRADGIFRASWRSHEMSGFHPATFAFARRGSPRAASLHSGGRAFGASSRRRQDATPVRASCVRRITLAIANGTSKRLRGDAPRSHQRAFPAQAVRTNCNVLLVVIASPAPLLRGSSARNNRPTECRPKSSADSPRFPRNSNCNSVESCSAVKGAVAQVGSPKTSDLCSIALRLLEPTEERVRYRPW